MKRLITILFLINIFCIVGVTEAQTYQPDASFGRQIDRYDIRKALHIPTFCGVPNLIGDNRLNRTAIAYDSCNSVLYIYNGSTHIWSPVVSGGGGSGGSNGFDSISLNYDSSRYIFYKSGVASDSSITVNTDIVHGGPITTIPVVGDNPGVDIKSSDWITSAFYGAQPPLATLNGGQILEYRAATTLNYTLTYTSSRQLATQPLVSIVVGGVTKTFSQPSAPGTVSGTHAVSFPANTNITYSNVTTSSDGKNSTATTSFTFLPMRYFGWISDTTGIGLVGFNDSQIRTLSSDLTASKSKSWNTGDPTGTQFYVYAYYVASGALTQFDMNGFPSLSAMNSKTRLFTNALGYTGMWIIYWSRNGQTLSSNIIAN